MEQKLIDKITKREMEGTMRSLSCFSKKIDFFSNDYLGFAKEQFIEKGALHGATGSRLISGTTEEMLRIEDELAHLFSAESGLMFNSGYDANLGFFSAVPQRGDTILYDALIHASVRDGVRLSFARSESFKHNDVVDLERKIRSASGAVYVAIEGLYSMDGDMAFLGPISDLCKKYGAYLVVDEAHSAGVFGENGKGVVAALGMEEKVFARLITFGKAYGSHGALFLGSSDLKRYLLNFSRSFIYTTALPEVVFHENVERVKSHLVREKQEELHVRIAFFRDQCEGISFLSEVNSPIQSVLFGDVKATREVSDILLQEGFAVKPIFSPTVAEGTERIRISLHSFNRFEEIERLATCLRNNRA